MPAKKTSAPSDSPPRFHNLSMLFVKTASRTLMSVQIPMKKIEMTFFGGWGVERSRKDPVVTEQTCRIESLCLTHFSLDQPQAAWFVCKHVDRPFAQISGSLLHLKWHPLVNCFCRSLLQAAQPSQIIQINRMKKTWSLQNKTKKWTQMRQFSILEQMNYAVCRFLLQLFKGYLFWVVRLGSRLCAARFRVCLPTVWLLVREVWAVGDQSL